MPKTQTPNLAPPKPEREISPIPTEREMLILMAITQHGTTSAAARALEMSPHTVDRTIDVLRKRSGFNFLPQILAWASGSGWLEMRVPDRKGRWAIHQSAPQNSRKDPGSRASRDNAKKVEHKESKDAREGRPRATRYELGPDQYAKTDG
jgi:hypothetical protein